MRIPSDLTMNPMYSDYNDFLKNHGIWVTKDGTHPWLRFDVPVTVLAYFTVLPDAAGLHVIEMAAYGSMDVYVNGINIWNHGTHWKKSNVPHAEVLNLDEGEYLLEMTATVAHPTCTRNFWSAWPGAMAAVITNLNNNASIFDTISSPTIVPWMKCKPGFSLDYHGITTNKPCTRKILVKCGDCLPPEAFENPNYGWSRVGMTGYQTHLTQVPPLMTHTHTSVCKPKPPPPTSSTRTMSTAVRWHPILIQEAIWPSLDGINPDPTKNAKITIGYQILFPKAGTYRLECSGSDYTKIMIGSFTVFTIYSGSQQHWYGQDGSITFPVEQGPASLSIICYHWSWEYGTNISQTQPLYPDPNLTPIPTSSPAVVFGGIQSPITPAPTSTLTPTPTSSSTNTFGQTSFHDLDSWIINPACVGIRLYDDQNNLIFNTGLHQHKQMETCACAVPFVYEPTTHKCIHRASAMPGNFNTPKSPGPITVAKNYSLVMPPAPGVPVQEPVNQPFDTNIQSNLSPYSIDKSYDPFVASITEKLNQKRTINNCCMIRFPGMLEILEKSHNGKYEVKLKGSSCYNLSEEYQAYFIEAIDTSTGEINQEKIKKEFHFFIDEEEFFDAPLFEPPYFWYFKIPKSLIKSCDKEQYINVLVNFPDDSVKIGFYINGNYGTSKNDNDTIDRGVDILNYLHATQPVTIGKSNKRYLSEFEIKTSRNREMTREGLYNVGSSRDDLADHSPEPYTDPAFTQTFRVAATTCYEKMFPPFDLISDSGLEPVVKPNPSFDRNLLFINPGQKISDQVATQIFGELHFKIQSLDSDILTSIMGLIEILLKSYHVQYVEHYFVITATPSPTPSPTNVILREYQSSFLNVSIESDDNNKLEQIKSEFQEIVDQSEIVIIHSSSISYMNLSITTDDIHLRYKIEQELENEYLSDCYFIINKDILYIDLLINAEATKYHEIVNELEYMLLENNIEWINYPTPLYLNLSVRSNDFKKYNLIAHEITNLLHDNKVKYNLLPFDELFVDLSIDKSDIVRLYNAKQDLEKILNDYEIEYEKNVKSFNIDIDTNDTSNFIKTTEELKKLFKEYKVQYALVERPDLKSFIEIEIQGDTVEFDNLLKEFPKMYYYLKANRHYYIDIEITTETNEKLIAIMSGMENLFNKYNVLYESAVIEKNKG